MDILLIMVVFIGLMYVLMVLPQKRKMDQQKKLIAALEPGTRVMLNTGMFGTIRAVGAQQMVVELAPGAEVTVLSQAVLRAVRPDEEEFEYDETSAAALASGAEGPVEDVFSTDEAWGADNIAKDPSGPATLTATDVAEPPLDFSQPADFSQPPATGDDADKSQGR